MKVREILQRTPKATRNIVFIGDSHLGSVRRAWDDRPQPLGDTAASFFALPAKLIGHAQASPSGTFGVGHLSSTDEATVTLAERINGSADISLEDVDAVVRVGPIIQTAQIFPILARFSIDDIEEVAGFHAMSSDAFLTFCRSVTETHPLLTPWDGPDVPHFVIPRPRQSEDAIADQPQLVRDDKLRARFAAGDLLGRAHALMDAAYQRHAEANGYTIVWQPEHTYAPSGLTKREFSKGSKTLLGDEHETTDFYHMNTEYGAIMLSELTARLETV